MMIKAFGEFLDFDDEIEVEKQIKLFEDISTTDGDFSYAFEIQKTINNTRILRNPQPDNISKPVYQQIPAQLLSDGGAVLHDGYIRLESITDVYECSFFSGNNNWFAMIDGLMSDLDLSRYDIDNNEVNIIDSWSMTEGLVFPLLDHGSLITRSYPQLKIEDFVGAFYVKTLMNKIFAEAGIKIQGELLEDWRYQNLVCASNSKNDELIQANSSYVEKNAAQVIPYNVVTKVTWDNDSVLPFYDGSSNNFDIVNNQFIPPLKMAVSISLTLKWQTTGFAPIGFVFVRVNGVDARFRSSGGASNTELTASLQIILQLNPGDVVDFYFLQINADGDAASILSGNVKITPTYIYRTIGSSAVPNWTRQEFVSNILRIFNVLASYNPGTATLTLNLFEKIKSKPAVDLSPYISKTEIDYSDFISDYAQKSRFAYTEIEFEELKTYNKGKFLKYGQGAIEVDNDFLEHDKEILKSDFANPIDYINAIFDASLSKSNLIELEEGESVDFSDVANDGFGDAAFNVGAEIFLVGDLARVSDSTNESYNGDWIVKSIPSGHVVFNGLPFDTAATGTITKLNYKYSSSDDVFLYINVPNYEVSKFSNATIVFDSGGFYPITFSNVAIAYFDLINSGRQINRDFIYSLSFGGLDDPDRYQVTMLESYFRLFSRVLNDPVKLLSTAQIPIALYDQIDFLSPAKVRTLETTNEYYLNRITGYKESYLDCVFELIKI
jgi:hypothetical protein